MHRRSDVEVSFSPLLRQGSLYQILKPLLGDAFYRRAVLPFSSFVDKVFSSSLACGLGYLAVAAAIAAFVVVDSLDQGARFNQWEITPLIFEQIFLLNLLCLFFS